MQFSVFLQSDFWLVNGLSCQPLLLNISEFKVDIISKEGLFFPDRSFSRFDSIENSISCRKSLTNRLFIEEEFQSSNWFC